METNQDKPGETPKPDNQPDNQPETQAEKVIEGNVIDVEPEVEPEFDQAPSEAAKAAPAQASQRLPLPLIIAIVAMLAVAISWIAGYRYWQGMLADLAAMQERITNTYQAQETLNSEIEQAKQVLQEQQDKIADQARVAAEQSRQLADEKAQITRQTEVMQRAVDQVNDKLGRDSNQWQLAEADYLLRIANHRLALARDTTTALSALQQADAKLRDSGDLGLLPVREKLADEINQLKAVQAVDIAGMAATLHSLAQQVEQLQLAGEALTTSRETTPGQAQDPSLGRSFDTLLEDSWRGFRELVVVRKHDQPVNQMLPPTQSYFVVENLRLQLESSRLALLRQENILFQSSLDTAIDWLQSFFDTSDPIAANMLATLQELKATELTPSMPNIAGSLNLLSQYRETLQ